MTRTILLADDSVHVHRMAGQYLGELGCRVVAAGFGEAAWRALRSAHPDLVMIDAGLPGIDGREFCRRMRAAPEWQAIPLLLLAGALDDVEPEPAGCNGVLRKPLAMPALAVALAAIFPGEDFARRAPAAPSPPLASAPIWPPLPPPPVPRAEPDPDTALLRQLLDAHLPTAQVETIVREWERRRRTTGRNGAI